MHTFGQFSFLILGLRLRASHAPVPPVRNHLFILLPAVAPQHDFHVVVQLLGVEQNVFVVFVSDHFLDNALLDNALLDTLSGPTTTFVVVFDIAVHRASQTDELGDWATCSLVLHLPNDLFVVLEVEW